MVSEFLDLAWISNFFLLSIKVYFVEIVTSYWQNQRWTGKHYLRHKINSEHLRQFFKQENSIKVYNLNEMEEFLDTLQEVCIKMSSTKIILAFSQRYNNSFKILYQ